VTESQVAFQYFPLYPTLQLSILVLQTTKTENVYLSPCLRLRYNYCNV